MARPADRISPVRSVSIQLIVAAATTALGMVGWGMLVLTPAIVDVMQQQGAYFNARMFRFVPGTAVTGLSALVGVSLVRRG